MKTDPTDGKPGLRIETAASITLHDTILKHMHAFGHVIKRDRAANAGVVAVYISGLAGSIALTVAGGHGSKDDVLNSTIQKLREAVDRDLRQLRPTK